jgi:hypothetical protein
MDVIGNKMTITTPVLFIVFNRPATTEKVFEAIRKAKPTKLYIAADAPRVGNESDIQKSLRVKEIVSNVDWACVVSTQYQERNLGCSLGPRAAFDWFFSKEERGIILEDDCVPNQSFFIFCQEMLEKFANDERIISINGSNLGYQLETGKSYTFSRFMNMWGWATWRRSAAKIDYSLKEWNNERKPLLVMYKRLRQRLFDIDINWYKYWQEKFDLTITNKNITWWDWQWIYHQIRDKQLSVVPAVNLISNIGFDGDATHTKAADNPAAVLPSKEMELPINHPSCICNDLVYEENYVKWVWCYHKRLPATFYVKHFISEIIRKKTA